MKDNNPNIGKTPQQGVGSTGGASKGSGSMEKEKGNQAGKSGQISGQQSGTQTGRGRETEKSESTDFGKEGSARSGDIGKSKGFSKESDVEE